MKKPEELTEVERAERDGGLWEPVLVEVPDIDNIEFYEPGKRLEARFIRCHKELRWRRTIEDEYDPPSAGLPLRNELR